MEQQKNITEKARDVRLEKLLEGLKKVNEQEDLTAVNQAEHLIWI